MEGRSRKSWSGFSSEKIFRYPKMKGEVRAILIHGTILRICCISNPRNYRGKSEEENQLLHQLQLSLPNNMDTNEYFSGYNLKSTERKQKFLHATKYAIRMGDFYFHSCSIHKGYVKEGGK